MSEPLECRHLAEVGQRPLRGAYFALDLRQLVGEGDEELAVALALVCRQCEDARQVVADLGVLLLAEVPATCTSGMDGPHLIHTDQDDVRIAYCP